MRPAAGKSVLGAIAGLAIAGHVFAAAGAKAVPLKTVPGASAKPRLPSARAAEARLNYDKTRVFSGVLKSAVIENQRIAGAEGHRAVAAPASIREGLGSAAEAINAAIAGGAEVSGKLKSDELFSGALTFSPTHVAALLERYTPAEVSKILTKSLERDLASSKRRWHKMHHGLIHVVDGDTIYLGKKGTNKLRLRVLGDDTPEIPHFGAGKFIGQPFGKEATLEARSFVKQGLSLKYLPLGIDKYGRTLAHVLVDDVLLSVHMIKQRLAYETITRYGDYGMPDLAAQILSAAKATPKPDFEDPHDFRQREWSAEKEAEELRRDLALPRTKMDKPLIKFDDGDTIIYKGEVYRIGFGDTPEIRHEDQGIFKDQPYGRKAAAYTKKRILNAGKLEFLLDGKEKYGRTLMHLFIDGELLMVDLINKHLAYQNISIFGPGRYPGLARLALAAAKSAGKPPFENPMYWRRKNQKKNPQQLKGGMSFVAALDVDAPDLDLDGNPLDDPQFHWLEPAVH